MCTLFDDLLVLREHFRHQSIGQIQSFVVLHAAQSIIIIELPSLHVSYTYLQCFQHRHIVQQSFVHFALAERWLEQNASERLSVHRPQMTDRLSLHSCRSTIQTNGRQSVKMHAVNVLNLSAYRGILYRRANSPKLPLLSYVWIWLSLTYARYFPLCIEIYDFIYTFRSDI